MPRQDALFLDHLDDTEVEKGSQNLYLVDVRAACGQCADYVNEKYDSNLLDGDKVYNKLRYLGRTHKKNASFSNHRFPKIGRKALSKQYLQKLSQRSKAQGAFPDHLQSMRVTEIDDLDLLNLTSQTPGRVAKTKALLRIRECDSGARPTQSSGSYIRTDVQSSS